MRIKEVRVCFDCDFLTTGQYCPVCGQQVTWHLSTWLDRRPEDLATKIEHKIAKINDEYREKLGNNGEEIKNYPEDDWREDR